MMEFDYNKEVVELTKQAIIKCLEAGYTKGADIRLDVMSALEVDQRQYNKARTELIKYYSKRLKVLS